MAGKANLDEAFRLETQMCFALYSASRSLIQAYRPILASFGITYPQYLTLLALWESDRISLGELGRRLQLDSGTLSPMLKRMQSLGLIEKARSSRDERELVIVLTEKGAGYKAPLAAAIGRFGCELGLKGNEIRELRDSVRRFSAAVENRNHRARVEAETGVAG